MSPINRTLVAGSVAVVLYDPPEVELRLLDAEGETLATASFAISEARKIAADIIKVCKNGEAGAAIGPAQGRA